MSRIKCSLVLSGDSFDPRQISEEVGCKPTMSWKKGEPIGISRRLRKECGWKLSVEVSDSDELGLVLRKLACLLHPMKVALKSAIRQHNLDVEVACSIYLSDGLVPSMHLDRTLVAMLWTYSAVLDIDLYPSTVGDEQSA